MPQTRTNPWRHELQDITRSLTRAMIFGIAFLYTMEAWWIGTYLDYGKLLAFFVLTTGVSLYLVPLTRERENMSLGWIVKEVVRNKGLTVLGTALILYVMGRITPLTTPWERDVATIVLLSIPVSIGSDISHILGIFEQGQQSGGKQKGQQQEGKSGQQQQGGEGKSGQSQQKHPWKFLLTDIASETGGALFVAFPLAPTMEIPMLAARMDYWRELALIGLSLSISYMIVYRSGIDRTPPSGNQDSLAGKIWPFADSLLSYSVSLLVSFVVLYLLGRIDLGAPPSHILALVIVLGLPATIGGAAGKLVL